MSLVLTIEGLDGTGKSTLAASLLERIQADQAFPKWIYQTKEPGLDVNSLAKAKFRRPGVDLRQIVLENSTLTAFERELLFYVDASQHRRFIDAQEDALIISDRGLWSHFAYAYATMKTKQMTYEQYLIGKQVINETCQKPDIIVYLQGNQELMKNRLSGKKKDVIESNGNEFFEMVEMAYEQLLAEPKYAKNLLVLDAENSTSKNVESIVTYLKETFTFEQLQKGNR